MIRFLLIGLLFSMALSSCKKDVLASATWKWKDHEWIAGDRKTMTLEATDTSTVYQMDLHIEHKENYKYQNLYVKTLTTFPSGKEVTSVTSLELVNADGSWAGDYGENCCDVKLPLQRRFTFPEIGQYSWTIEPYMRIDTIKGIKAIKVTCKELKE